ncbi:hypothetical protein BAS10_08210 [Elizabethkingia meningoseptica]|uniref:hypothetical protein n=1 Tax=Elizabethkingia meningoseptica TaxID=238 RepID=UPI000999A243|nr:hypothetical protein [Elizabethkingia meningoseptica]OPB97014.1 hypothetical protein BAS10_08210 [Elizabethkingia meningoseptica]
MRLEIGINDFQADIEAFINRGEELRNTYRRVDYEVLDKDFKKWRSDVMSYLDHTLNETNNIFTKGFEHAKPTSFMFQNVMKVNEKEELKKLIHDELLDKVSILRYFHNLIKISDAVTAPELAKVGNRIKYNTRQKLDLILEKLYDLKNDRYYSIELILELNGIKLQSPNEGKELAKDLERRGLIIAMYGKNQSDGKITLNGKIYVEDKRETTEENYDNISSNQQEVDHKVNEILVHLQKLGYGQEIIFEEIEELKSLYTKLNKKNWGQIVKGKLVDIALSKVVDNDTIAYVYEHLTNNHLRLP